MYRVIIVFSIMTLSCFKPAKGQNATETLSFLEALVRPHSDTLTFFYTDKVDTFILDKIKRAISESQICGSQFIRYGKFKKRCIKLTVQERNHILSELDKYRQSYWKQNFLPDSRLVTLETLQRIKNRADTLQIDGAKVKQTLIAVNQFIKPIFFHSDNMFIMLTVKWWLRHKSYQVAAIDFDITIHRKENEGWKRWVVIDGGVWDF